MANRSQTLRTLPWSVAAAFVSAVAGAQTPPASHPLPPEFLSLPADVAVVAGIDLRAVFASAEFKALAAGVPLPGMPAGSSSEIQDALARGLKDLEKNFGVAADRDLDLLLVAVGGF